MKAEDRGAKSIETTEAAEVEWAKLLDCQFKENLVRFTDSWWTRANVPGARVQPLTYLGGLSEYEERCKRAFERDEGLVYTVC
jgi:acetone monooxygenase (methyl acetate-forming)